MRIILFVLASMALSLPARADVTVAPFADWNAVCDTYRQCSARISSDVDPDTLFPDQQLAVSRDQYDDDWAISLTVFSSPPAPESTIAVNIDGSQIRLSPNKDIAAFGRMNRYYALGKKAQDLLSDLVAGTNATITYMDTSGATQVHDFSLSGLAASLLWIDDRQDRVGSPRTAGAAPSDLDRITDRTPAIPLESLDERNTASGACEPRTTLPETEIQSYRLDAKKTVHFVPCWAGAYNFGYTAWLQEDENLTQLYFADYSDENGWSGTPFLVNPGFDGDTGTLNAFYKGRGLGDCGSEGAWIWNQWNFKLLRYAFKQECDSPDNPGDFPVIYRAGDLLPPGTN